jgi:hypothetical protein
MLRFTWLTLTTALLLASACTETRRAPGRAEGMNPGECSDGADNDGDGFFDCNDSDCARAPNCSDGAVPDSSPGDTGGPPGDTGGPPRDAGADTRTGTDTGVTPDTSGGMCIDVSGSWESTTDCPLLPLGEVLTITRTGDCEFSVSTATATGTATAAGDSFTIMITSPVPVTCTGTYSESMITSDCLGCVAELRPL